MNKISALAFVGALLCAIPVFSQITIPAGTTMSITGGTTVTMAKNLTVGNGGTLVTNGNILMQSGDFSNNGTASFANSSTIVYSGSTQQQLNTTTPLSVGTLVLNNPTGLAPNNVITVTNSLILANGIFYADTSLPVHFANGSNNPNESNSSYISGRAILDSVHVGTSSLSFLGCNIASGADMGTVSIVRNSGPDGVIVIDGDSSIAQAWIIGTTNTAAPSRNINFSWLSAMDNNRNMTAIYPYASPLTSKSFVRLVDTARNVSATDPRVYLLENENQFNRIFTFVDRGNVSVPVVNTIATKVTAFPNPFGSVLSLSITKNDDEPVQVRLMDMNGKVIIANTYQAGRSTIITLNELEGLSVGNYLLQVYNDHFGKSLKIVKAN